MKEFNKIKYIPLKYQNEIRSVSNPKQSGLNLNNTNKFQGVQHLKNINLKKKYILKNKIIIIYLKNGKENQIDQSRKM